MLTRLFLALFGWLGHRLGRAAAKSAMTPQSLATLNPDLLRQMPPRTRKRWRCFRVLRPLCLLLLAGCDLQEGPAAWAAVFGIGVAFYGVLGAVTVYARLRWWGGVLRVRNTKPLPVQVFRCCGVWYRTKPGTVQTAMHRTLTGAIWAALGLRFPLVVHWGPYPGRIEFVKWRYGARSSWRHGTAYLRWFKVMWALLLLLSSPTLAGETGPNTGGHPMWPTAHAQTAAQELTTAGLNRQDREMVLGPEPMKRMGSAGLTPLDVCERALSGVVNAPQPARWPWVLGGLLVGALLGIYLLARTGRAHLVYGRGAITRASGWWITGQLGCGNPMELIFNRTLIGALRDAWRLSRGLPVLALLLSGCTYQPVGWAALGIATALTVGLLTRPRREVR